MQATQQAAKWLNDDDMDAALGDWWTQEMDLHEGATMAMNVEQANSELLARGSLVRVQDCREAADGENLDWLVTNV